MADPTIDAIKQKIDVKDFVAGYVALKPAGRNLKGLCPFHKEKSPSFMVNPERQIWHCFGCGKGGDIFAFLMQFENIEFIEALKVLADRAGVELKRVGTSDQKKYEVLYEINRIAKDYFRASMWEGAGLPAAAGNPALAYLKDRGLKEETINEFELGVALPGSDNLMRHLVKLGFSAADIERAGLIFKTERGMYYDRFRNRIMFPLHNHFGKVIGFTGRVQPGEESPEVGKYVNSPETPIFQKSKLLYGFWKTKNSVREQNQAVLVEGQMDFLMTYQDGVKNVVATSGTALTDEHLKLLRRLAENLVLSFDNDSAGKAAAERTIDLAQQNDLNTKVIVYAPTLAVQGRGSDPSGVGNDPTLKDPADIAKNKPGHFAELIGKAIPAMEYYFNYYGIDRGRGGDFAILKKGIRQALQKIKGIASPIEQQHWLQLLASRTGLSEQAISAEMNVVKISAAAGAKVEEPKSAVAFVDQPINRLERIVRRILSLALRDKIVMQQALDSKKYFPSAYQPVLEYLAQNLVTGTQISDSALAPELIGIVNLIYLESGFEPGKGETEQLFAELSKEGASLRRKELQEEIRKAELSKDAEKLTKLLEDYRDLARG